MSKLKIKSKIILFLNFLLILYNEKKKIEIYYFIINLIIIFFFLCFQIAQLAQILIQH